MQLALILARAVQMANVEASSKWRDDYLAARRFKFPQDTACDFAQECALIRLEHPDFADCQTRSLARRSLRKAYR